MTPLDRLMFAQGHLCFYCGQALPKGDASVDHLLASSKGGGNGDDNRVACCKAVNALFGSMSLKEKFQVVLRQKGQFKCPNAQVAVAPRVTKAAQPLVKPVAKPTAKHVAEDGYDLVVDNLKRRGVKHAPRSVKALMGTIRTLLPKPHQETDVDRVIAQMTKTGFAIVAGTKVGYDFGRANKKP